MSDNANCPFCDLWFDPTAAHPFDPMCPLSTYTFTPSQWNMRPPKKEVGHTPQEPFLCHLSGEVGWLRSIVERLTINPELEYKPNEATK